MTTPEIGRPCQSLGQRLALVLPKNISFGIYHISTPPRKTDALYSAPPNLRPDRTYCETQLLAVTINIPPSSPSSLSSSSRKKEAVILAIEVFIYTTAHSSTLFVSKADSTGYLHLLKLAKGTPSPIRQVCTAFIQHLIEHRKRPGVQFVVSLFARSQGQYLFPGSADHGGKHVLDDRNLIKWWCRVLDPLVTHPASSSSKHAQAYLVIPGLDTNEMRAFVPRNAAGALSSPWSLCHPLEKISHYHREFDQVPPRCLIPRFPDDPKSRFRDELDAEAGLSGAMKRTGRWESVKTLDEFWETMAIRQECSSGRMTGFIWIVFGGENDDDDDDNKGNKEEEAPSALPADEAALDAASAASAEKLTAPRRLRSLPSDATNSRKAKRKKKSIKLRGPIKPRQPKIKTEQRNRLLSIPEKTAYYSWPVSGRGDRIVDETTYKRIHELMLHTDFSTPDKAVGSSARWIHEVGIGSAWGHTVTGQMEYSAPAAAAASSDTPAAAVVNNLSGLIKRKSAQVPEGSNKRTKEEDRGSIKRP